MVLDDTTQGIKGELGAQVLWHAEGSSPGAQPQGLELGVQQGLGHIWVD